MQVGALERHLRGRRDSGAAILVPFVTAGVTEDWTEHVRACADAGADAVEIGLPFSDPMLDGTAVQRASHRALERGTTPLAVLERIATLDLGVPLVVMTYSNPIRRHGIDVFCRRLADSGVGGLIAVDTPHAEVDPLAGAAEGAGVELVLMVAPSTPSGRLPVVARRSRGFVYAATVMSPTGERTGVPGSARDLAASVRRHTSTPVLLGFGISAPADAARAATTADGVVVGSALMRRVLDGARPGELADAVLELRTALDEGAAAAVGGGAGR